MVVDLGEVSQEASPDQPSHLHLYSHRGCRGTPLALEEVSMTLRIVLGIYLFYVLLILLVMMWN
jgi:hypothetical protein